MHMQGALQTLQNASFRIKHYDFKWILIPKIYLGTYHKLGAKLCLKLFFFIFCKLSVKEEDIDCHTELFHFTLNN